MEMESLHLALQGVHPVAQVLRQVQEEDRLHDLVAAPVLSPFQVWNGMSYFFLSLSFFS
jgi:hypothetical protein